MLAAAMELPAICTCITQDCDASFEISSRLAITSHKLHLTGFPANSEVTR